MGASLCCLGRSPALSLYAALDAPSERLRSSELGASGLMLHQGPDLEQPVIMTRLWPLLDRSSKAALRCTCKRLRLAVDSYLQHVATASIAEVAAEGVLANTGSGHSTHSSISLRHAHFPPSWSHITSLTLRNMQDVGRLFQPAPSSTPTLQLSSLQMLTIQLDKCTHNQLRRLMRLPAAARVTHLQLDNCQCLSAVSVLVACSNLVHLSITERDWDDRWRDATIHQCTHLQSLHLRSRFVSTLPLSMAWSRLREVNVSNCKLITSLVPLLGCTSLRSLDLCGTGVCDLLPLAACTQLSKLTLSRCGRALNTSLEPLCRCTALISLNISWTNITDLAPLAGLAQLQHLDISNTHVADLSPLTGCIRLQELDTSFCERLTGLAALGGDNNDEDADPAYHPTLRTRAPGQPAQRRRHFVPRLVPAASQLRWLDISACYGVPVGQGPRTDSVRRAPRAGDAVGSAARGQAPPVAPWDLAPLAHCTALQALTMSRNGFTSLSPLSKCAALLSLDLSRCLDITSIAPLASCTALTALDMSWTGVSDLSPLADHTQLARLDASHCSGITDLAALGTCTQLEQLLLRDCSLIEDLRPLANCRHLALLNITRCNRIVDLSPLATCRLGERGRLLAGDDQHIMSLELQNQYPHY